VVGAQRAHLFSAELTAPEMDRLRTSVEVTTYGQLLAGDAVDWVTLGQVATALGDRRR
jgi:hypothetical protein